MGDLSGLLLVHGDEAYIVDRTVGRWRAAAGNGDVEVIEAPQRLEPLIASLVDMPLFAAERHVLVRDLPQLTGARRGSGGAEELIRALAMRAPTTNVCFTVRATVAPSNPILLAIAEFGGRVIHHPALRSADRRQWLDDELRRRAMHLPDGGAQLLLRSTSGDLGVISGELDKITAHGAAATLTDLQQLVAGTEQLQLYNVLDLLAAAQPARGAALLKDLVDEGRSIQYLLSILAGQLRDLLMAHALLLRGQRGAAALATAARMPGWRAERVLRQAQGIPARLAMAWLRDLQRIDARQKAGEIDDAAALQLWGLAGARALSDQREARRSAGRTGVN